MKLCVCYNLLKVTKGGDRMKESAGEANMTVITIVLIGIVAAAGAVLIPQILKSSEKSGCCQSNGGVWQGGTCYAPTSCSYSNGKYVCSGKGTVSTSCNS
mgnify:CR=1 FL=1